MELGGLQEKVKLSLKYSIDSDQYLLQFAYQLFTTTSKPQSTVQKNEAIQTLTLILNKKTAPLKLRSCVGLQEEYNKDFISSNFKTALNQKEFPCSENLY